MGQQVAVEESAGGSPAIVRFETNRSLTGSGHERFTSADQAKGPRPAAVIARRFFASGQVAGVHVYGNIISATLAPGATQVGLNEIVQDLYQYWKPGMTPPTLDELLANMPAEASPAATTGDAPAAGGDGPIPAWLVERSAIGRARWIANNPS